MPADASAAALTVTATDARSAGFVTVLFPTGTQRQLTANVNFNGPGEIVANGAIVALGAGGSVDIFVAGGAGIVVDVSETFVPPRATRPLAASSPMPAAPCVCSTPEMAAGR